jgi:hypothetical protein
MESSIVAQLCKLRVVFNPFGAKQGLTFPQNGSIKRKEQGLEILLVTADRAGSPIAVLSWMTGFFVR